MADKMLIDAAHPEETRVVVLRGNRVEEFDFESANRKQLRGNIYLAKVTRVEPSLQAAFVDYGGNRHGFLAFSEIHPDYYQIPVADRQALIAEEARQQREADDDADHRARGGRGRRHRHRGQRQRDEVRRSEPLAEGTAESPAGEQSPLETAAAAGDMPEAGQPSTQFNDQFGDQFSAQEAAAEAAELSADEVAGEHAPETSSDAAPEANIEASAHELGDAAAEAAPADAPLAESATATPSPPTATAMAKSITKKKPSSPSAAPTRWKKCRSACRASAASTRSRKSSSAARSCWCRWSRKSAAPRVLRSPPTSRSPAAIRC